MPYFENDLNTSYMVSKEFLLAHLVPPSAETLNTLSFFVMNVIPINNTCPIEPKV